MRALALMTVLLGAACRSTSAPKTPAAPRSCDWARARAVDGAALRASARFPHALTAEDDDAKKTRTFRSAGDPASVLALSLTDGAFTPPGGASVGGGAPERLTLASGRAALVESRGFFLGGVITFVTLPADRCTWVLIVEHPLHDTPLSTETRAWLSAPPLAALAATVDSAL